MPWLPEDQGKVIYVTAKTLPHRLIVAPEIKSFEELKQKNIAKRNRYATTIYSGTTRAVAWKTQPCGKSWSALAKC